MFQNKNTYQLHLFTNKSEFRKVFEKRPIISILKDKYDLQRFQSYFQKLTMIKDCSSLIWYATIIKSLFKKYENEKKTCTLRRRKLIQRSIFCQIWLPLRNIKFISKVLTNQMARYSLDGKSWSGERGDMQERHAFSFTSVRFSQHKVFLLRNNFYSYSTMENIKF